MEDEFVTWKREEERAMAYAANLLAREGDAATDGENNNAKGKSDLSR